MVSGVCWLTARRSQAFRAADSRDRGAPSPAHTMAHWQRSRAWSTCTTSRGSAERRRRCARLSMRCMPAGALLQRENGSCWSGPYIRYRAVARQLYPLDIVGIDIRIKAAGVGILIGVYIAFHLAIVADEKQGFGWIAGIIESPLFFICQWLAPNSIGLFFLCHIIFWSLILGLVGLGVGILLSKLLDD